LGPPVWEPGPKILGGPADAPETACPAPAGHHFGGAGGDALRAITVLPLLNLTHSRI
jgi:hypothetical protein